MLYIHMYNGYLYGTACTEYCESNCKTWLLSNIAESKAEPEGSNSFWAHNTLYTYTQLWHAIITMLTLITGGGPSHLMTFCVRN